MKHNHIYIKAPFKIINTQDSVSIATRHYIHPDPDTSSAEMSDTAGLPGYSAGANLLDFISAIKHSIMWHWAFPQEQNNMDPSACQRRGGPYHCLNEIW